MQSYTLSWAGIEDPDSPRERWLDRHAPNILLALYRWGWAYVPVNLYHCMPEYVAGSFAIGPYLWPQEVVRKHVAERRAE